MILYDAINKAWEQAMPEGVDFHARNGEHKMFEVRARLLDKQLAEAIQPHLEQYQEGLISASDLFVKIAGEAGKELNPLSPLLPIEEKSGKTVD